MDWTIEIDIQPSAGPALTIDRVAAVPAYRQIYDRVRDGIAAGRLRPGERLPAVRCLASQLGLARGTVDTAYAMLAGEGWIVARGPGGTIVAPQLADGVVAKSPAMRAAASPVLAAEAPPRPFRLGLPALDAFPRKLWSGLVAGAMRELPAAGLGYPDPAGYPALREAIAAYLAVSRGIACAPRQVFVTAGYQGGLSLIAQLFLRRGDSVWFEDPGYHIARQGLAAAGAALVPVPVDANGVDVAAGIARAPQARLAVVTPAHQAPLGVGLSLPRRLALLAWARAAGALIVEDDYDGEFHYDGRPLPALKSLDHDDVVIYAGSFSKTLFPALRLGYLVVPEALVERLGEACRALAAGPARLEQAVVTWFLRDGHFARHLKRMRGLYAARRAALAGALAETFGDGLRLGLQSGGMHLLAWTGAAVDDTALAAAAEAHGLAPTALSSLSLAPPPGRALLLSFTNIPAERAAPAAQALRRAIGPLLGLNRDDRPAAP